MNEPYSIPNLEERLGYTEKFNELIEEFDRKNPDFDNSASYLKTLRIIKTFLAREKYFRYELFKGTNLRGSDCLTLAILEAIIAGRKGYKTHICRPDKITYYLHAALVYKEQDKKSTFQVAGKSSSFEPVLLNNEQIMFRLKITKPFVDFVNRKIRKVYN